LAWYYQTGQGVRRDVLKAIRLYEKAAEQNVAQAQANLGVIYDEGKLIPEHDELAVYWYEKAAAQGHEVAMFNLAVNYFEGQGVAQDHEKAWNLFNKVRTTSEKPQAQERAQTALENMKEELGINAAIGVYPLWEELEFSTE